MERVPNLIHEPLFEPVIRPDGLEQVIIKVIDKETGKFWFEVDNGLGGAFYSVQEVELLGGGDLKSGLLRLGRVYFEAPQELLVAGKEKLLK